MAKLRCQARSAALRPETSPLMGCAGTKDGGADGAGGPPAAGAYKVKFKLANLGPDASGKGEMTIEVHPEWAPIGAAYARASLEPPVVAAGLAYHARSRASHAAVPARAQAVQGPAGRQLL